MNELRIMNKSNKKFFRKAIDNFFLRMQIDSFQNINCKSSAKSGQLRPKN